jgi:hypothetical protein
MKKLAFITVVLIFALSMARAEEPATYTNETFARLSCLDGNVYIQRATELDYEEGVVNMPVTEGDRMGTTDGRAEIYMGRGKYLRLDYNTKIDFLDLPGLEDELTRLQIWRGNIFFSIMSMKREKTIEIHSPDASLYILEAGLYRIDVRENESEIFVFKGMAEIAGETGSVLIKEAQRLKAIDGHFSDHPSAFTAFAADSFDRWSEARDYEVRKRMAQRYLPEELEDFEYELASNGEWTYEPTYGYVWVPWGMDPGWRPYRHGRWIWLASCGWTWLPYEPWGWAVFHFGRWHWSLSLGWYWIPTEAWGPGWVHWYWGYDYIAWAPVSYWGYPGVVINNTYYGHHMDHYYPDKSRALTVIHKNQLRARNVEKVALGEKEIEKIGKITLGKIQPAIRPEEGIRVPLEKLGKSRVEPNGSPGIIRLNNERENSLKKSDISKTEISKRIRSNSPDREETRAPRNIPKQSSSKKADSTLGKIYNFLSGEKSRVSKSRASSGSTSKSVKSSTKSKASPKVKKTSAPKKSSSRSRTSSTRVKKKK